MKTFNQYPVAGTSRKNHILAVAILFFPAAFFCQPWVQLNNIGTTVNGSSSASPPVTEALSLSLNNKIYVVGSKNFTANTSSAFLWEYNTATDTWTQKSAYPGNGTSWLCGFALGNQLYMGCGTSGSVHALSDFYKYNPATNTWSAIANLPVARLWGVGFSIGGTGYITGGEGSTMSQYLNDLWAYDTTLNTWTAKTNFPGTARALPIGFANKTAGFVGLGFGSNIWCNDLYKYTPATDTWTVVSSLPAQSRGAVGVAMVGDQAIAVCGNSAMTVFNDCYAYNTTYNSWSVLQSFGGSPRSAPICGSAGNKIFVGGGSSSGGMTFHNDWWTMSTSVSLAENEIAQYCATVSKTGDGRYLLSIVPPNVSLPFRVLELSGKHVYSGNLQLGSTLLPELTTGIYMISFPYSEISTKRFCAD